MAAAGVFGIAAVAGLRWADDPMMMYRWHRAVSGVPAALAAVNEPIDLVTMGSSRMMRAIDAPVLARAATDVGGRPRRVFDLSRPYRGPEADYLMLRSALARGRFKTMLVEYKRGSAVGAQHRNLTSIARLRDVPYLFWRSPGYSVAERLQASARFVLRKFAELITMRVTGTLRPLQEDDPLVDGSYDPTPPKDLVAPEDFAPRAGRGSDAPTAWDLDASDTAMDTYMVESVVRLGRQHDVRPVFLHVPRVYEPPLEASFLESFEQRFGAPLLSLPVTLTAAVYPTGYADGSHMNERGARLVGEWLARQSLLWQ